MKECKSKFLCQNKTVSRIVVLIIFNTRGKLFFLKLWQVIRYYMTSQSISLQKKWLWSFSFDLNRHLLEFPLIPRFCFGCIAQNISYYIYKRYLRYRNELFSLKRHSFDIVTTLSRLRGSFY